MKGRCNLVKNILTIVIAALLIIGLIASQHHAQNSTPPAFTVTGMSVPWTGTVASGVVTSASAMSGTISTQVVAGQASKFIYINSCHLSNNHASVDTSIQLQNGSGGTVLDEVLVPHASVGRDITYPTPLKVPTLGNGLFLKNVTTGSSTYGGCQGFATNTGY